MVSPCVLWVNNLRPREGKLLAQGSHGYSRSGRPPASEAIESVPPHAAQGKLRPRESLNRDIEWSCPGIHTPPQERLASKSHFTRATLGQALPESPTLVPTRAVLRAVAPPAPLSAQAPCSFQPERPVPTSCSVPSASSPAPGLPGQDQGR